VPSAGYEFLPHTTDAYIQANGSTFEEALEYAGVALFDTMCEVKSISPEHADNIQVTGTDEVALAYNWLEALLLKFELERKVYSKFKVRLVKTPSNEFKVVAKVFGETWNRKKHGAKVEVKAVTYHRMEVSRDGAVTILRFILDL
jgi:SHS2 domain-containing protein